MKRLKSHYSVFVRGRHVGGVFADCPEHALLVAQDRFGFSAEVVCTTWGKAA